jgi:UDP-N-acetylmuramoylalanine--D-glutamate ligase
MNQFFFKNKKVTVMGFGLHGWGLGAVNWLAKRGAKVTITDLKSEEELEPMLGRLKGRQPHKLVLGRHRKADFAQADIILQNPGVPRESKFVKIAKAAGALIENDASLFIKNCPGTVIGVTGTRGKSTTSALIYEILKNYRSKISNSKTNLPAGRQVGNPKSQTWLAGLPQMPLLGILDNVKKDDIAVLELSSWQCEILGEQQISPAVAVITNIYPDHLNRYSGMADYIAAKANIIKFQNREGICVLNYDNPQTRQLGRLAAGRRYWFSKKYFSGENGCFVKKGKIYFRDGGKVSPVAAVKGIKLLGGHNLENVLAAACVANIFKVPPPKIISVLKKFKGLPSRIETIAQIGGVRYINDTTATTPDGTMAALRALGGQKNIILIAGGETKNIPNEKFRELAGLIKKHSKAIILFSGKGSAQLLPYLKGARPLISGINTMADAVGLAGSLAKNGDIILLSPACASFNLFINEYDRGEQFNDLVKRMV